jgi:hypothetical protein
LIALELAEFYKVDPDVFLAKPIRHIFWLKAMTLELAEIQARARRDAAND